jgi:hypothetical protein
VGPTSYRGGLSAWGVYQQQVTATVSPTTGVCQHLYQSGKLDQGPAGGKLGLGRSWGEGRGWQQPNRHVGEVCLRATAAACGQDRHRLWCNQCAAGDTGHPPAPALLCKQTALPGPSSSSTGVPCCMLLRGVAAAASHLCTTCAAGCSQQTLGEQCSTHHRHPRLLQNTLSYCTPGKGAPFSLLPPPSHLVLSLTSLACGHVCCSTAAQRPKCAATAANLS